MPRDIFGSHLGATLYALRRRRPGRGFQMMRVAVSLRQGESHGGLATALAGSGDLAGLGTVLLTPQGLERVIMPF